MNKEFDAVIVGAGPAGSTFSRILAENGFQTLMVDRRKEIGIPVRCGEGVGEGVFKLGKIKPHSDWAHQINSAQLISKSGAKTSIEQEGQGYVVERRMMDKLLALKAVDAGAKLLTGTTAINYKKGKITTKSLNGKQEFTGKIIIGADGIESYIARLAGLSDNIHPHELDSCFQYEMKGINMQDPHAIQLYFGSMAPRGYVWIFPKGKDRANVGLGIAGDNPRTAKSYLDAWIKGRPELENASITQVSSGNISVTKPLKKVVKDRLMIIGTAARHVSPIHGGGIYDAMLGAEIAANTAVEALEEENTSEKKLKEYQKKRFQKYGKTQHLLYKFRKAMEHFTDDDFEYYLKNFKKEWLDNLSNPQGIKQVLKLIMKRPNLKAVVSGLLS